MAARKRIFNAVFPSSVYVTAPTPTATPLLGSSALEGSFHVSPWNSQYDDSSAGDTIRWERTWHNVTAFLALPKQPVTLLDAGNADITTNSKWFKKYTSQIPDGVSFLVTNKQSKVGEGQDDLIQWYFHEVAGHFIDIQLPLILQMLNLRDNGDLLTKVLKVLRTSQMIYFYPLDNFVLPILSQDQIELTIWMERYHALVARSLSTSTLTRHLRDFLLHECSTVLGVVKSDNDEDEDEDTTMEDAKDMIEASAARGRIEQTLLIIADVGLGGAKTQQLIAEVMSELQTMAINVSFAGSWKSPSIIPLQLEQWVEVAFTPFVVEVLAALSAADRFSVRPTPPQMLFNQTAWQDRALHDLGALRTRELFEIIVDWDNNTKGAIEDLKLSLKTPRKRMDFTKTFSKVVSKRLLQPGASTAEILQVYTRVIRAFAVLDPKGVLLDRISSPIVNYLRERDDTVKIVIAGLLGDDKEDSGLSGLVDLVAEAQEASSMSNTEDQGELDYDNMSWVPDPVDAGPNFKSKNSDMMGILIALFDPIDIFLKEFQNVMGDRLLRKESEFDNEIRVLEILKKRFGDVSFQACEVMLKDIFDSRGIDSTIRKEQQLHQAPSHLHSVPKIHTKILSRFFWPALLPDAFAIPQEIHSLQARYEQGFERLKTDRKLTWLPALGQVTIELQLEDREVVVEELQTWQASVIYAFQDAESNNSGPVVRTVEQLVDDLDMDEALVSSALNFWVSKFVLQETSHHTYTVLETLNRTGQGAEDIKQAAAVAAATDAATAEGTNSAIRSDEDVAMEKMNVFWQFIVGMLTNQGAMPLPRIVMMLKFAVPGGFPFSNEELKEYLGRKVQEGEVELAGGVYKRGKRG